MPKPQLIVILAGAPTSPSLSWTEEGLLNTFVTTLRRYLDPDSSARTQTPTPSKTAQAPSWRSLLSTIETPCGGKESLMPMTEFVKLRVTQHGDEDEPSGFGNNFLGFSYAVYDELQSSQIASSDTVSQATPDHTMYTTTISFNTTFTDDSHPAGTPQPPCTVKTLRLNVLSDRNVFHGQVTDLRRLPDSNYLRHIHPQTMTVNLIVGIISLAPTRTVTVRRGSFQIDIIEVLVGDATSAGFSISFWLPPENRQQRDESQLRKSLIGLRLQDVVLLQGIALSSYCGRVFGQSLNRKITKNSTCITLLGRAGVEDEIDVSLTDTGQQLGPLMLREKAEKTSAWVSRFVGPGAGTKLGRERHGHAEMTVETMAREARELPPDTQ
ncbi:hypothetical protein LTR66_008064 [Elasticomyces elasticus]|nr:hypothetical protein LTR66_008064 [Elasticomyces elasticus]